MRKRKWKYLGLAVGLLLGLVTLGLALRLASGHALAAAWPTSPATLPTQERGSAWLGVQLANLDPGLAQRLSLSRQEGVVILRVLPQSPAAQAGLQARDIVLEVNGRGVSKLAELTQVVGQAKPGNKITLKIWRGGEERSLEVILGSAPAPKPLPNRRGPLPFDGFLKDRLGGVEDLFERFLGGQLSFKDKEGQRVTLSIASGTIAAVGADSITITPADGASLTFQVTGETKIAKGGRVIPPSELRKGDLVMVVSIQPGVADLVIGWGLPKELHRPLPRWFGERPPQPRR